MKDISVKRVTLSLGLTFGIILIFSAGDYFFHQLSAEYAVPPHYFPNKIIYGTIIGFVTYWLFVKVKPPLLKSLIFSAAIAVLLQIRYFLEGYPLDFVVLFLFIHFAILWLVSWGAFTLVPM